MDSPLLQLPEACLQLIMQHLASLGRCEDVCSAARSHSRLHAAALPAFIRVAVTGLRSNSDVVFERLKWDSFQLFSSKYGQHIRSAFLLNCALTHLPVGFEPNELNVLDGFVQLRPTARVTGVLHAATNLTRLQLSECRLDEHGAAVGKALAQLPSLVNLDLGYEGLEHGASLLSGLTHLTSLSLQLGIIPSYDSWGAEEGQLQLQHISSMIALKTLKLNIGAALSKELVSGLQHLTQLELTGGGRRRIVLQPAALGCLTGLQHLVLQEVDVAGGAQSLLLHMGQLQQLTYLRISDTLTNIAPSAAAYTALTASSNLQQLDLPGCNLPRGVWEQVFRQGLQLPLLRHVCLGNHHGTGQPDANLLSQASLAQMVACCPNVERLSVKGIVEPGLGLQVLSGLSCLTELSFSSRAASPPLNALPHLPHLNKLSVDRMSSLTDTALLQLTRLQSLSQLTVCVPKQVDECGLVKKFKTVSFDKFAPGLNWASDDHPPSIQLRIAEYCMDSADAAVREEAHRSAQALAAQQEQRS